MISFSLKDLVTTGKLGYFELGMKREQIIQELGMPYNWHNHEESLSDVPVIEYGGIELFFDKQNNLDMIFIERWNYLSDEQVQVDSWIFTSPLNLGTIKDRLDAEQIVYEQKNYSYRKTDEDEYVKPELYFPKSGVRLVFESLHKGVTKQQIEDAYYPALIKSKDL